MTIPRLRELIAAYERRYHRQLHDLGIATALAQHDPQKLETTFKTPPAQSNGDVGEKWW